MVLPALFLLTDFWWNPELVRCAADPRQLEALPACWPPGAVAGVALFWKLILGVGTGDSAGFGLKDFTWYQYLFTQCRALFVYIFNFLLPVESQRRLGFPDLAHASSITAPSSA